MPKHGSIKDYKYIYNLWFSVALRPQKPQGSLGQGKARDGDTMYLSLHCHHQNDSYIQMGSDESRFNVLLIVFTDRNF